MDTTTRRSGPATSPQSLDGADGAKTAWRARGARGRRAAGAVRMGALAALVVGAWAGLCGAQPQAPQHCPGIGLFDVSDHTCQKASGVMPSISNAETSPGVRPYDVSQLATIDPCRGEWRIEYAPGDEVLRRSPRWVGHGAQVGHEPPFASACVHELTSGGPWNSRAAQLPPYGVDVLGAGNDAVTRDGEWGYGAALGVNLLRPLSLGDFVSPGDALADTALALLPAGGAGVGVAWNGISRPVVGGVAGAVDMITGAPLVRIVDMELPFGGATFRLARTRSQKRMAYNGFVLPNLSDENLVWSEIGDEASTYAASNGGGEWWDWTGLGWMASENPFLLIDSALADVDGVNTETIRLVLDAHHSIPFQRIGDPIHHRYEAPPRFRASLRAKWPGNASSAPTPGALPTHYEISLYDGEVTMTFVAIREDVPTHRYNASYVDGTSGCADVTSPNAESDPTCYPIASYHERPGILAEGNGGYLDPPQQSGGSPTVRPGKEQHDPKYYKNNRGFGIPHYGLCTRMADRYGHVVEIEYASSRARHMDDPRTDDCIECQQDGLARGQIKWIKLISGGEVKWMLVYVHRRFVRAAWFFNGMSGEGAAPYDSVTAVCPEDDPGRYELRGSNAIDRILAYRDPDSAKVGALAAIADSDLVIHHTTPARELGALAGIEQLPTSIHEAIEGWTHGVQYHYDRWQAESEYLPVTASIQPQSPLFHGVGAGLTKGPPVLVMTTMATRREIERQQSNEVVITASRRVYNYEHTGDGPDMFGMRLGFDDRYGRVPWLSAVYEEDDVGRALADLAANGADYGGIVAGSHDLTNILVLHRDELASTPHTLTTEQRSRVRRHASARFAQPPSMDSGNANRFPANGSQGTSTKPTVESLLLDNGRAGGAYIKIAHDLTNHLLNDCQRGTVELVQWRDASGALRVVRLHRISVSPRGTNSSILNIENGQGQYDYEMSMPSRWFVPYRWRAYLAHGNGDLPLELQQAPQLHQPRFIVVIDEFGPDTGIVGSNLSEHDAWANATSTSFTYSGDDGIKAGQTSRRVVQINASGVVLKDHQWQFTPGGVVASGGGLGEEAVYKKLADVISAPPAACDPNTGVCDETQPSAQALGELVLVEERSVGWSAAETYGAPDAEQSQGLVRFYRYELLTSTNPNTPWRSRVQRIAEGVQRGSGAGADRWYTRQLFYDAYDPTQLAAEVQFLTHAEHLIPHESLSQDLRHPPISGDGPHAVLANRITTFEATRDAEGRVASRFVVHPPRQARPGGTWYYPVEREIYDDRGNAVWSVSGMLANVNSPSSDRDDPNASLIFTYHKRDGFGVTLATVVDVGFNGTQVPEFIASPPWDYGPADSINTTTDAARLPSGWFRIGTATALNYVTRYDYDGSGALTDVYFPVADGQPAKRYMRRWAKRDPNEPGSTNYDPSRVWVEEYEFPNVVRESNGPSGTVHTFDEDGAATFMTQSPIVRKKYRGEYPTGAAEVTQRGEVTGAFSVNALCPYDRNAEFDAAPPQAFTPFAEVGVEREAGSSTRTAVLKEGASLSPVGGKEVNDLVDVLREEEFELDSTSRVRSVITRTTRNPIGQHMRTYVGSGDCRWEGSATHSGTNPPPCNGVHDMILTERLAYGQSPSNAWRVVSRFRYESHPHWADTDFYRSPESRGITDIDGYETRTSYDWRMRAVRVDTFDKLGRGGRRMGTTLTYLDHADRAWLVVTFGADLESGAWLNLPSSLDPTNDATADGQSEVSIEHFYALAIKPTSIVWTRFGPDGSAYEVRRYDVAWNGNGDPPYQAEWRGYGQGGQEVFARRPGSAATATVLDGLGRASSVRTIAFVESNGATVERELSRVDTVYDPADGTVVAEHRLERVNDAAGHALEPGVNAVRSTTFHWYDTEKRRIATAEIGTGRDEYATTSGVAPTRVTIQGGTPADLRVSLLGAYPGAIATINEYDRIGNLKSTILPSGSLTEYVYDDAKRLMMKIENDAATREADKRVTEYAYDHGKLVEMSTHAGVPAPGSPLGARQVTRLAFGAPIVDDVFNEVSYNWRLIGRMHLPSPNGDEPSTQPAVSLKYTFSGQIAERIDARGVAMRYSYDALQRLALVEVGNYDEGSAPESWVMGYPASMTPAEGAPTDRVMRVEYFYDARGNLERVIAHTRDPGPSGSEITGDNVYTYDLRGNLLGEVQSHGVEHDEFSPEILYEWSHANAVGTTSPGHSRLTRMTYPSHGSAARVLDFTYGVPGSVDDQLSLVRGVYTLSGQSGPVASFSYVGAGRRARLGLGNCAIVAGLTGTPPGSAVGLPGLDRFGRTRDLHYTTHAAGESGARTLYRTQYRYDGSGNRTAALVTQADEPGSPSSSGHNTRSQLHSYNALDQLTESRVGTIDLAQAPFAMTGEARRDRWSLDPLGNWNGNGVVENAELVPGRRVTHFGVSPEPDSVVDIIDTTDSRNRITMRHSTSDGMPATTTYKWYDAAGNLECDSTYIYDYDGWNRLVRISRAIPLIQSTTGIPPSWTASFMRGELIKHSTYDGLGRLIRTQSPYPDWQTAAGALRSERFYYDGVRRVQEVVVDPTATIEVALASQNTTLQQAATSTVNAAPTPLDPQGAPLALEQAQVQAGASASPLTLLTTLEREYVWAPAGSGGGGGAGGAAAGVDELLVEFDRDRAAWYVLQDDGGDVAAVCSVGLGGGAADSACVADISSGGGSGGGAGSAGLAFVARQYTYDAYGQVQTAAVLNAASPPTHVGHKGLFVDRLDVGVVATALTAPSLGLNVGDEIPRLVPCALVDGGAGGASAGSTLVYYNRNRTLSPRLGRFLQSDPNGTGSPVLGNVAETGRSIGAPGVVQDLGEHSRDGLSAYQYLRSAPLERTDPLGLFDFMDWSGTGNPGGLPFDVLAAGDPGGLLTSMLEGMIVQYAANLEADVDWATDWSAPDDAYSRLSNKWVTVAWMRGAAEHFGLGWMIDDDGPYDDVGPDDVGPDEGQRALAVGVGGALSAGRGLSKLKISKRLYNLRRAEYRAKRMERWREEIKRHPDKYTAAQKQRVRLENKAPIGSDGYPMEIHHRKMLSEGGSNLIENMDFLTRTAHRLGKSYKRRHKWRRGQRKNTREHRRRAGQIVQPHWREDPSPRGRRGDPPRDESAWREIAQELCHLSAPMRLGIDWKQGHPRPGTRCAKPVQRRLYKV